MKIPFLGLEIKKADRATSGAYNPIGNVWGSGALVGRTAVTEKTSYSLAAYYRGVQIISEAIASLPIDVIKKTGGKREQVDHISEPLLQLQANNISGAFAFKQILISSVINNGNGYAVIERDGAANPISLNFVKKSECEPVIYDDELWWKVKLSNLGNKQGALINDRDMINIRGFGNDPILGIGVIEAHKQNLGLSIAAQDYGADFYNKSTRIDGYLKVQGTMDAKVKDGIANQWQTNYGPNGKRGIAILDNGTEYTRMSITPEDAKFIDTRKFQKNEIATMLGIPAHMINELERSTFSNIEHQGIEFVTYCLNHYILKLEEEFRRKLLKEKEKPNHYYKFNINALLRTDKKAQAEHYRLMTDIGIYSINDIRALQDLNPVENGDTRYIQLNRIPLDQAEDYFKDGGKPPTEPTPPTDRKFRAGFDPNQPRDEEGKWGDGGNASKSTKLEDKPCFKEWFGDSKVVDENGEPLEVYHGSSEKIDAFDYEFTDKGNDQYGSGFYFTTDKDEAKGYGENVHSVYLSMKNPMNYLSEQQLTRDEIKTIILNAPDLDNHLWNYGDIGHYGKEKVINDAVSLFVDYSDTYTLQTINKIANDFYNDEVGALSNTLRDVLGYDGVEVGFEDLGRSFFVSWFPEQIKSIDAESFCDESNINRKAK